MWKSQIIFDYIWLLPIDEWIDHYGIYIVFCGDFILLNNFVAKVKNIAKPNKYKEIGVFLEKKL